MPPVAVLCSSLVLLVVEEMDGLGSVILFIFFGIRTASYYIEGVELDPSRCRGKKCCEELDSLHHPNHYPSTQYGLYHYALDWK